MSGYFFPPSFPVRERANDKLIMKIKTFPYSPVYLAIKKFCVFIMPLDMNKYWKYVDEFDLTEKQKVELLQSVWSIMESFVDTAFGLHPAQNSRDKALEKDLQSPIMDVKSDTNHLQN